MSDLYYMRAFPYKTVHRLFARAWQQDGPGADKREYGVETTGAKGCYRRWFDCAREEDLQKFVLHPQFGKLNVGAMFDKRPGLRWKCPSGSEPKPIQKEFVVDVDMDDYEYLGLKKTDIEACDAAFAIVGVGLEVVIDVLRKQFGFQHILPVYSGRRGAHLWVCDKRACLMTDPQRKAIIDFLKPGQKTHASGRKTFKWLLQYPSFGSPENPMQKQGLFSRIVYKFFRTVAVKPRSRGGLGLLDSGFDRSSFLKMIDDRLSHDMETSVRSAPTGLDALILVENTLRQKPVDIKAWLVPRFCEAICTLCWPRVDEAVSTHMNHTLKAPFSVHPGTGRVSVPILDKSSLWQFDPSIESPMASDQMPASFATAVQQTDEFITKLMESETEQWQPPDLTKLEPPPKRMRYDVTVGTSNDGTPILSEHTRVAWVVTRSLSVYVDDDGTAHFEMSTRSYAPSAAIVIPAHQYPPFAGTCSLERVVEYTLSAIATARDEPNTAYSIYSWQQIVVVDPDVTREGDALKKANARFERLRERLAEGCSLGEAKVSWGEIALARFVTDVLWPFVEELRRNS